MKKILATLLLVVLVFSVSMAYADGKWHYCKTCGREHSGTMCPEQCINECELNKKGVIHKWYECPYRTIGICWHCGEETEIHNENCCPTGKTIWNDYTGTFKTGDYAHEEGAQTPRFCKYCGYYGYHDANVCLNRPVEEVPTLPEHVHEFVSKTFTESEVIGSKEICEWETTYTTTYCETCRLLASDYADSKKIDHSFKNGICVNCGFEKEPIITVNQIPSTPQPIYTPLPTEALKACAHEKVYSVTEWSKVVYDNKDYCHIAEKKHDVCYYCGEVVETYTPEEFNLHNFEGGICQECGYTKKLFSYRVSLGLVILCVVYTVALIVYAYTKRKK